MELFYAFKQGKIAMVKSVETTKNSDGTTTKTTTYDNGATHSVRTEPGALWDHVVSTKDTPPKK